MAIASGWLTLRIDDDGRGLAAINASADVPHYGLRSMHERAAAIGARLEVGEGPRGGTIVTLEVPLAGHELVAGTGPAVHAEPATVTADRTG